MIQIKRYSTKSQSSKAGPCSLAINRAASKTRVRGSPGKKTKASEIHDFPPDPPATQRAQSAKSHTRIGEGLYLSRGALRVHRASQSVRRAVLAPVTKLQRQPSGLSAGAHR